MPATIVAILLVVALLAGLIFTLRTTARSGMPPRDVLDRAARRANELESAERTERDD